MRAAQASFLPHPFGQTLMSTRITVSIMGDLANVRFNDKKIVDGANIEEMGNELTELVTVQKYKHILLNFEGVDLMSSEALNKLIKLDKKVKAVGGVLRLCSLKPDIREVFTITKLDRLFDIRDTERAALKAFGLPG
jgi:anti-sigma B factor antagonist